MGEVIEYAEFAHELEAEERLGYIMDTAAGTGNLKRGAHGRHMRDLRRRAAGRYAKQGRSTPRSQEEFRASAQAIGIEVVIEDG